MLGAIAGLASAAVGAASLFDDSAEDAAHQQHLDQQAQLDVAREELEWRKKQAELDRLDREKQFRLQMAAPLLQSLSPQGPNSGSAGSSVLPLALVGIGAAVALS